MSKHADVVAAARSFVEIVVLVRAQRRDFILSICKESEIRAYLKLVRMIEQLKDEHLCSCGLRVDDTHPKGDF